MVKKKSRKKTGIQSLGQLLQQIDWDKKKYISQEFQDYGYRLAQSLDDLSHKSLYIKLAKITDRRLLEEAKNFVKGAYEVKSKAKLFMWKLKQLRNESKTKQKQQLKTTEQQELI